jgi:ribose transport system substrate-binding protein
MASCNRSGKNTDQRVFGATFMTMDNPFYVSLETGLRKVIEANGDRLIILDPQFDQNKQNNSIEDWIQQKLDGIFVCPVDSAGITPALEAAQVAGIPIIDVDTKCDSEDLVLTQVVSDCVLAGRQCGEELIARMGTSGKVVMLTYSIVKPARDRAQGFKEVISKYPDIQIVAEQDVATCSIEGALPIMESMLQAHPDLTGVFGINDPIGLGCMAALENANMKLPIVTVDGSDDVKKLIVEGRYTGTAAQFPDEIGKKAAELMYEYINNGAKFDKEILIDTAIINADNVKEYL